MRDFHFPGRSSVFAANGMCASSHPLASRTAVDILRQGGNAVDAAIAAVVVVLVAEPHMSGLGGDCYAMVKHPGSEDVSVVDGTGQAPARLDPDQMRTSYGSAINPDSANAVTVPGMVDALCTLSETWGKLDLATLLAPGIHYAEEGVPVAPRISHDWRLDMPRLSGHARKHYGINDTAPLPGQMFRAPATAEVLRRIAKQGRKGFYEGEIAQDIVATLQSMGGVHSPEDFTACKARFAEPVTGRYWDTDLVEAPLPSQGPTAILAAHILNHFDVADFPQKHPDRAHLELEAAKLARAARDRCLLERSEADRLPYMLSQDTALELAGQIDPDAVVPTLEPHPEFEHLDTAHLCVVDRDLMAVTLISSLFNSFGSGIATEQFGILLHNRGAGFSLQPGHPNEASGGKHPMHMCSPAMLRDNGQISTVFGVTGGSYQPSGHARIISNLTDHNMGLQQAIDAPRSHAENGIVKLERGYPKAVVSELECIGHTVEYTDRPLGGAQAIRIDYENGVLEGVSDPRQDGCALGY